MYRAVLAEVWREQPARQQLAWVAAVTDVEVKTEKTGESLALLAAADEFLGLENRSPQRPLREALLGEVVVPTKKTFDHPHSHV